MRRIACPNETNNASSYLCIIIFDYCDEFALKNPSYLSII